MVAHYRKLRDRGLSVRRIAELSGLCEDTLMYLGTWTDAGRVELATSDQVLAVPLPDRVIDGGGMVPSVGTRRRLEALMLAGWSGAAIGARLGVTAQSVSSYRTRAQVTARTAVAVRELCSELWMTPGSSTHTARRAAASGWAPFLAWDDIDDPEEQPNLGERSTVRAIERYQELRDIGLTDNQRIAEVLGIRLESLSRTLSRSEDAA
ncbi:hypothetical protein [Mycolicibacterium palauense]|uniref:hypothetical protein n=1 Tax=Mycolicibacterium palauense TaxID=2034511 RepID=UPI000BFECD31|nr:hypothetical protein [Mycolicibacterium palauense]